MPTNSVSNSSGQKSGNSGSDAGKPWAALDSRFERLAVASDQTAVDAGDKDRELKVAS
jgi:hypothetical protein